MIQLFDTHAHLQDRAFKNDADAVLRRAFESGLAGVCILGYDAGSNIKALELCARHPAAYPAVGFHPHDTKDVTPSTLADLEAQANLPEVVAIGEIGLDFYRDNSPRDIQRRILDEQLGIAVRAGKPVLLHTRSAEDDIYEQLAPYAAASPLKTQDRPVGVMHCFGGTLEQARRYVDLGFLVSLACVITYPKNDDARAIARELPLDSLVVETDSPYLPPQHERGKRNEPANVRFALEAAAAARSTSITAMAAATTKNACRLFAVEITEAVPA